MNEHKPVLNVISYIFGVSQSQITKIFLLEPLASKS